MAKKTKIDLVMAIIEIIYDGSNLPAREALRTRDKLQLRLQKVSNNRLDRILGNFQEALVCRYYMPGKGYCNNLTSRPTIDGQVKIRCAEHSLAALRNND